MLELLEADLYSEYLFVEGGQRISILVIARHDDRIFNIVIVNGRWETCSRLVVANFKFFFGTSILLDLLQMNSSILQWSSLDLSKKDHSGIEQVVVIVWLVFLASYIKLNAVLTTSLIHLVIKIQPFYFQEHIDLLLQLYQWIEVKRHSATAIQQADSAVNA